MFACIAAARDPNATLANPSTEEAHFVSYIRELDAQSVELRPLLDTLVRREPEIIRGAEALARDYLPPRADFERLFAFEDSVLAAIKGLGAPEGRIRIR